MPKKREQSPPTKLPLRQFFSFAIRGKFTQYAPFNSAFERALFLLKSLPRLSSTRDWLHFVSSEPALRRRFEQYAYLAKKLHRPYQYHALPTRGKLKSLKNHYRFTLSLPQNLRRALLSDEDLLLATVHGKNESVFKIVLTRKHRFHSEGELAIRLTEQTGMALATLTFNIGQDAKAPLIDICGLQGPANEARQEAIKNATKACYGLFPKRLVLEVLLSVARHFGITKVRAISNLQHVCYSRHYIFFKADYNAFWESLGAQKTDNVFYALNNPLPRKALQEIASKKRSEYTRRYQLLDTLDAAICTRFTQLASGT